MKLSFYLGQANVLTEVPKHISCSTASGWITSMQCDWEPITTINTHVHQSLLKKKELVGLLHTVKQEYKALN